MKKYCYHILDTDEKIYADSGDEFEALYKESHDGKSYSGNIELTNMVTGEVHQVYRLTLFVD